MSSLARFEWLLLGGVLLSGCGADEGRVRGQWLVSVETDAPVPQLADRLLLEVFRGETLCPSCTRHLAAADAGAWPISFGVTPAGDVSIQATLFRAALIREGGLPGGDALLQARVRLPESGGVTRVSLRLSMDCFGVRADAALRKSCDPASRGLVSDRDAPETDASGALQVGSWPLARTESCGTETPDGMVCIHGGLFLLGDVSATLVAPPSELPVPERLVRVSPFFLDNDELSVGQARGLLERDDALEEPELGPGCTYLGVHDDRNDGLPLNCVSRSLANAFCQAQGKQLPTEAQWEYAAGNLDDETPYPWGHDDDVCAYAVVARATDIGQCRATPSGTLPPGVQPVGTSGDVSRLGVRDLAGNVSEWLADDFRSYAGDCWQSAEAALLDPVCSSVAGLVALRGGNWALRPDSARAVRRGAALPEQQSPQVGFRCARMP